jgi:diguanylate cyclase (GGDEF)-like protein/PAS domain S-box-containing protein
MNEDDRRPAQSTQPPSFGDPAAELALYRLIVENVADIIVRGDSAFRRTYVSPAVREILGYEPAELIGGNGLELVHPDDRGRVQASLAGLGPSHPRLAFMFRMRRKDESYIWIGASYRHLSEDNGVLAVLRDITKYKAVEGALAESNEKLADANLALQALAHRDGLTGLANRRCFDIQLAEEFRRARRQELPLALALLDVDDFKMFNDRYGHVAGDDCLCRISRAIEGVLRRPGDLAARYGGEEIAVLLPATDEVGATAIAGQMREAVAALGIEHLGSVHGIATVSAGISALASSDDCDLPADLVAAADRALYQAKLAGRNKVRVAPMLRAVRA